MASTCANTVRTRPAREGRRGAPEERAVHRRPIGENIAWGSHRGASREQHPMPPPSPPRRTALSPPTPQGYDTPVAERGDEPVRRAEAAHLSIARAVVKPPEILIFDDSTSALDLKTEARLLRGIAQGLPGQHEGHRRAADCLGAPGGSDRRAGKRPDCGLRAPTRS